MWSWGVAEGNSCPEVDEGAPETHTFLCTSVDLALA